MAFVWSTLTDGNPAYTVVQVATNDLIILVAFVPIVKFLLGVSNISVPYSTLFISVFLFVVVPLAGGVITRVKVIKSRGTTQPKTAMVMDAMGFAPKSAEIPEGPKVRQIHIIVNSSGPIIIPASTNSLKTVSISFLRLSD